MLLYIEQNIICPLNGALLASVYPRIFHNDPKFTAEVWMDGEKDALFTRDCYIVFFLFLLQVSAACHCCALQSVANKDNPHIFSNWPGLVVCPMMTDPRTNCRQWVDSV